MALIVADDSSFKELIDKNASVIVKYYADWCGSCKLFAPKYKRLSNEDRFQNVVFLDVNAEQNPEARKYGNVKNLPTFAVFKDGQLVESVSTSKEEAVIELIEKVN